MASALHRQRLEYAKHASIFVRRRAPWWGSVEDQQPRPARRSLRIPLSADRRRYLADPREGIYASQFDRRLRDPLFQRFGAHDRRQVWEEQGDVLQDSDAGLSMKSETIRCRPSRAPVARKIDRLAATENPPASAAVKPIQDFRKRALSAPFSPRRTREFPQAYSHIEAPPPPPPPTPPPPPPPAPIIGLEVPVPLWNFALFRKEGGGGGSHRQSGRAGPRPKAETSLHLRRLFPPGAGPLHFNLALTAQIPPRHGTTA